MGIIETVETSNHKCILENVLFEDYKRLPFVSKSSLDKIEKSPAHYKYHIDNPDDNKETPALVMGSAIHTAVLEPDWFDKFYFSLPEGLDRRTKEGKATYIELMAKHDGKKCLSGEDYAACMMIRDNVMKHPKAGLILQGGKVEASMFATLKDVKCKGRADFLSSKVNAIFDVKSTEDARALPFQRSVFNYRYHVQAAMYCDMMKAITGSDFSFVLIAVENSPPYQIALYNLDHEFIASGRVNYENNLWLLKKCMDEGVWPGYDSEITTLERPAWAAFK